ncbi:MAG: ABC transporter ATP-binding protein [Candidatus Delongbacteria bacterium]|jgi:phospholipid/cholesterol/gamma-HCH transport system ATP-binding protein|nr:ABC transporter ATP-binding protein [Candidatus Delongbacteria bacterium]
MEHSNKILFSIKGLSKSFGPKDVLKDVSFDIFEGEILCVIGQSGIGKSVLIKHLNGLLDPDKGKVLFEGKNISDLKHKDIYSLRKRVAMLFQSGALFDSMNVEENLILPLTEHTKLSKSKIKELVAEHLTLVGMAGIEKLHTSELSGGMKKRVALARAIIQGPEVLLYDEPTTGLDPVISDVINDLILNMNSKYNLTSVVITHDMRSVRKIADRVIMIHEGRIIFDGNIKEIEASSDPVIRKFIS